jgi:DNA-directed RNA polymerase subunit RPC12/RpoP
VTSINSKLGIKRAGKRRMMNLPTDRDERSRLTAAQCPECNERGARNSQMRKGHYVCSWCGHKWLPVVE